MQMLGRGRRWRGGTGLVLGVVAPVLIVTACTADKQDSAAPRSGTATVTSISASRTTPPVTTAAPGHPGATGGDSGSGGGAGTGQTAAVQPGTPGGVDNCGIVYCGAPTESQSAPGGTDTCGVTFCGTTSNPAPAPGGTDYCGDTPCDTYVKCTDKINYAGDPRSNNEINSIGARDGKCPEPIHPTTTSSAAPLTTTTVAPTTASSPTTTVTTTTATQQ
ncbi:hypothetical protein ACQP0C_09010 [Nocardia sp. CA-129566]|uniref:hypothetical protein n=1 Tax=Nocardia sp. CA-129566 TaxID=3239976 RepID=UPI003D956BBA